MFNIYSKFVGLLSSKTDENLEVIIKGTYIFL